MRKSFLTAAVAVAASAGLVLSATPALALDISAKGASFSYNMLNACAAAYPTDNVTYQSTGSGTGRTEFAAGRVDWAGTDGLYKAAETPGGASDLFKDAQGNAVTKNSKFMTIPLLGGPIVFAYNLPGIGDGFNLDSATVSKILKGDIRSWADPSLVELNPKAKLPKATKTGYFKVAIAGSGEHRQVRTLNANNEVTGITYVSKASDVLDGITGKTYDYDYKDRFSIRVAYRESGSGTTTNLTRYLSQTSGSPWHADNKDLIKATNSTGTGTSATFAPVSTSFPTAQDLAEYVEDTSWSFGYFDLSDALTSSVGIAKLKNAAGAFVAPSSSAAAKLLAAQTVSPTTEDYRAGTVSMDFTKVVSGAYQASIITYGLAPRFESTAAVYKNTSTDAKKIAVRKFFEYVVGKCVPANASRLGYVALSGALKTSALNQIKKIG